MFLEKLSLVNFKNHSSTNLTFQQGVNCIVGSNGVGKTNVLDAIYYMSYCKGMFNPIDSQNITHDAPLFVVEGFYQTEHDSFKVYCGVKRGQKKVFKWNKVTYERLVDHIGKVPLVHITPSDTGLITEGSEMRRKFMDSIISQYDSSYLNVLVRYQKVLSQRNALLKMLQSERRTDNESLLAFDAQLDMYGTELHEKRKEFALVFNPLFLSYYSLLTEGKETTSFVYQSALETEPLSQLLLGSRSKDYTLGHTTQGTHKDDLKFLLEGHPMKKFGSQGQQKSFVVALKLAQFDLMSEKLSQKPLLLLDDIFDKLDKHRVKALMTLVSEQHFGQVFVTDANKQRIDDLFADIKEKPLMIHLHEER